MTKQQSSRKNSKKNHKSPLPLPLPICQPIPIASLKDYVFWLNSSQIISQTETDQPLRCDSIDYHGKEKRQW